MAKSPLLAGKRTRLVQGHAGANRLNRFMRELIRFIPRPELYTRGGIFCQGKLILDILADRELRRLTRTICRRIWRVLS
jgi:hypothetical protein